ncbi:MAG: hypothetical protein ACTSVU_01235 [Promethearchaeota archaeon]
MTKNHKYSENLVDIEFDFSEMNIILTFSFKTHTELTKFLAYRQQFELADFRYFKHTNATSEFKTWIESKIQNAIDNEDMYKDWEFRFCGGEETNEKTFQHVIFYSIEPNLDENWLHY